MLIVLAITMAVPEGVRGLQWQKGFGIVCSALLLLRVHGSFRLTLWHSLLDGNYMVDSMA